MPFEPKPGTYYRMPVLFGPTPGPRQWPDGGAFTASDQTFLSASVSFLTAAAPLEALLPPGFALWGEPVATLDVTWMRHIPWLAGRGYAMSDFKFPVVFHGAAGPVHGTLVLVRWENLADPILSGRDELGHAKLYCEIPDLAEDNGRHSTRLSWLGHAFAELELWDLVEASPPPPDPLSQGQLHYKYVPRTGLPGEADAAYATLSPNPKAGESPMRLTRFEAGRGRFEYRPTRWEDFPFCHHVVSAIAALEVREFRGAHLARSAGSSPFPGADTRILG